MCRWVPNLEALFFGIPENGRLFFIPLFLPADWPKQRVQLARLIYHEPALEVRFVRKAMGTTSFLTIWEYQAYFAVVSKANLPLDLAMDIQIMVGRKRQIRSPEW
jgi:hypothetical protein